VKPLKLLIVPAVLLLGLVTAVPAFAHQVTNATLTIGCDTSKGTICVELTGTPQPGTDERILHAELVDALTQKVVGSPISLDVPAYDSSKPGASFDSKACFPPVTGSNFEVWVWATDKAGNPADLTIVLTGGKTIQINPGEKVKVGKTGQCTAVSPTASPTATPTSTPTATPTVSPTSATPTPSATATPVATLASTGGFDFRVLIAGLAILVAGLVLMLVGVSRGRTTEQ
jgi:hypothetical protein